MMGPGSQITIAVAERGYVLVHDRIYQLTRVEIYPSLQKLKDALDYHLTKHEYGEKE